MINLSDGLCEVSKRSRGKTRKSAIQRGKAGHSVLSRILFFKSWPGAHDNTEQEDRLW